MDNNSSKSPDDFMVLRLLGEDNDSTVVLGQDVLSGKKFAIKILEKLKLLKSEKLKQIEREQRIIGMLDHPYFIKLYWQFEDEKRLYFVLSFAQNGNLLNLIESNNYLSLSCTRFYAAELVLALKYLEQIKLIHRDLKPENILLTESMHIQISDFGTAKIYLEEEFKLENGERSMSFVGTAEYVPPELLTKKISCQSSDLWSLGCIIYQMLSGKTPFHDVNEYQVFENIINCNFDFPERMDYSAKLIITALLQIQPDKRLGCKHLGGFSHLQLHPFFEKIDWNTLPENIPPTTNLPILSNVEKGILINTQQVLSSKQLHNSEKRLQCSDPDDLDGYGLSLNMSEEERTRRLSIQSNTKWHHFSRNSLILKQGILQKKRGLSFKFRYFLLTEEPCFLYIDEDTMEVKGQIPWSTELRTEVKTFKVFLVHVPGRTYHLIDRSGNAIKWCKKIEEVKDFISLKSSQDLT